MNKILLVFALLSIATADKWALFVSGYNGYDNYCITSTICRGYDIIHNAGIPEDHVVYMGFTDVFEHSKNPYPGKIFTDISDGPGVDYAPGCRYHMDYTDKQVTAELFMATLSGDKAKVTELTGIENPRVIESTSEDSIFVYYMDHGADGFCQVGNSMLRRDFFTETVKRMYANKQYKQLIFYFEACFSGSMFRDIPEGMNVYAMTGADSEHEAMECNCPPHDIVDGKPMGTCLSAFFDHHWMTEVTNHGSDITLNEMFKIVHDNTAQYSIQNISRFGDISTIGETPLSDYIGEYKPTYSPKVTQCTDPNSVEDVPMIVSKWAAIRSESNSKEALEKYKEVVMQEALKEIVVMRTAREYYKDDKKADEAKRIQATSYDSDCVSDLSFTLVTKCDYTLPFRKEHMNVLKNICSNGKVNLDFEAIC